MAIYQQWVASLYTLHEKDWLPAFTDRFYVQILGRDYKPEYRVAITKLNEFIVLKLRNKENPLFIKDTDQAVWLYHWCKGFVLGMGCWPSLTKVQKDHLYEFLLPVYDYIVEGEITHATPYAAIRPGQSPVQSIGDAVIQVKRYFPDPINLQREPVQTQIKEGSQVKVNAPCPDRFFCLESQFDTDSLRKTRLLFRVERVNWRLKASDNKRQIPAKFAPQQSQYYSS